MYGDQYCVPDQKGSQLKNTKVILNEVSGEFRAGELSGIMGPSGSGKTTLLNILSGYKIYQTSGTITVNGEKMQSNAFRKMVRYISQFDYVDPYFTAWETLQYASHFKLKSEYSKKERETVLTEILDIFNLREHTNTMSCHLSGGERKRLTIAMELLDGPSILFLDEPTTGLDEFSAAQCVRHLKDLAIQTGCTVICSIDSPSAKIMTMFNSIYAIADGMCIYQGTPKNIVPYLQQIDLTCPLNYNPGDFLIEVATHAYGNYHLQMVAKTENGKICMTSENMEDEPTLERHFYKNYNAKMNSRMRGSCNLWFLEFYWNLMHIFQQLWRDKMNLYLRVFADIFLSSLIGLNYTNTGDNGLYGYFIFYMSVGKLVKCIFISMSPMVAYISQQKPYLRREHFNQWYRLSSYYMALLISQFILTTVMAITSSALVYFLSNQPLELDRFLLFFLITFLTTLMGSTYGLFIGSVFDTLNALFMGPAFMAVWFLFALYSARKNTFSVFDSILVYFSGLRYALEGLMAALLLYDRADLKCPEENFCKFSKPSIILRVTGLSSANYLRAVGGLLAYYLIFGFFAFRIIRNRLRRSKLMKYPQYRQFQYYVKKYMQFRIV